MKYLLRVVFLLVLLTAPSIARAQQNYPGAAFFAYQCSGAGIVFTWYGTPVIEVTLAQIATPLSVAISIQQNLPIRGDASVSLWALKSNELQIHENKDPDSTKLVLSSGICGPLPMPLAPGAGQSFSGQALSYVQLNGPGQALAFAQVTATGQVQAYAEISGSGQALALAQSSGGAAVPGGSSGRVHIVAAGENLFRIALRYRTTVSVLVALNNLSNASLIYVGQTIYLP
jgi:LysM repeat protein